MTTKLLFISVIITLVFANICHPQTYLQDVYSASLKASTKNSNNFVLNKSKDSTTYAYNLPRMFSKNPQTAFALSGFNANQKVDFTIFISIINTTPTLANIVINTPWKNTDWTQLSFNILLNARTDIQVGSYSFGSQSNFKSISIPLRRSLPNISNYVARAFISGFDLSGNGDNSLNVIGGAINNTHFPITVRSSRTIKLLQISYFLFNPKLLGFSAYGGSVNKNSLSTFHHQSVFRSVASLQNYIYGITGFSINSPILLINTKIDQRFLLSINPGNGVNSLAFSYIIFGNSPKLACNSCNNTIVDGSHACVSSCSPNQALYTFGDGGKACIYCPVQANLRLNSKKTDCVCMAGFTLTNGICLATASNNISETLIVPAVAVVSAKSHQDVDDLDDFIPQPYVPHKCPDPNSFWDGSRCSCLPKYYLIQKICQPCSYSTFWNGQTCVNILYGNHQKKKERKPQIPQTSPILVTCNGPNQFVRADNKCGCVHGFYMNNGVCAVGIQCPQNSVRLSATSCQCSPGFFDNHGFCTKCRQWNYYNQRSQTCQPACPANSVYNLAQQRCICLTGYYQQSPTSCLACPQGSNWVNGICVTCPIYSTFVNGKCVCLTGYTLQNGICRPTTAPVNPSNPNLPPGAFIINGIIAFCPIFTTYNQNLQKCLCIAGYTVGSNGICQNSCQNGILINGVCNLCPINSSPNGGSCVCNSGYTKNNGICTLSCNAPYFLYQGNCVSCPISSTWNQNTLTCNCNTGFIKNTYGICVNQCPVGSALINNACQCISGFFSTSVNSAPPCNPCSVGCLSCTSLSTCASCSNGFTLNAGACKPNAIICLSNQFLYNNICVNCPNNCQKCNSIRRCISCSPGFQLSSIYTCQSTSNPSSVFNIRINNNFVIEAIYPHPPSGFKIISVKPSDTNIKCLGAGTKIFCERNGREISVTLNVSTNKGDITILVPAPVTSTLSTKKKQQNANTSKNNHTGSKPGPVRPK